MELTRFSADQPFCFETEPVIAQVEGRRLCAWLQCRSGENRVVARWLDDAELTVLSAEGETAGPPRIAAGAEGEWVVWESQARAKWSVVGRRWVDGEWGEEARIAAHGFDPALCVDGRGAVWCVFVDSAGARRSPKLVSLGATSTVLLTVPTDGTPCFRPQVTIVGNALWVTWEAYVEGQYRVCAWKAGSEGGPMVVSDGPGWDVAHDAGADAAGRLWVVWVNSRDCEDGRGIVDQLQTLRSARLGGDGRQRLGDVAELSHGMLINAGAGGYLGRRRHLQLVADGEKMWVVWERKDLGNGHTRIARGVLCGKRIDEEGSSAERELYRGLLSYEPAPTASDGRLLFVAREVPEEPTWDSGVTNVFENAWGTLVAGELALTEDAPEFHPEEADGWEVAELADRPRRAGRRREALVDDEELRLFWGDPHFHTAQTRDAEGEVDELLHYARDKARLDFCGICDNDVYCQPLTDHEWARQQRLIEEFSEPGKFVVIPSYEWSWADPETTKPNHRLILYAETGEPVWRQVDPGGRDIEALASSVARTSGLLIGHHLGWVFAESAVEAAIEIVSAWSPHVVVSADAVHEVLDTGRRLGFTGGSDSHRRNPGFCGALTGVYAEGLTAKALVEGIRRRRTIATTGSMIGVDFRIGEAFIGDDVELAGRVPVSVTASAARPLQSVAVIRDGELIREWRDLDDVQATLRFEEEIPPGEHWYYARVTLQGEAPDVPPGNVCAAEGLHAWTSPIWVK